MPREPSQDRILVAGSLNVDLVVQVSRQPQPGDTVLGGDIRVFPGGKGANQAVAASRAGGRVTMLGCIGEDEHGSMLRSTLRQAGVDDRGVLCRGQQSGIAFITVDAGGENMIVVSPGANGRLRPEDAGEDVWSGVSLLVAQLEIPHTTVESLCAAAGERGVPVLLNPAPARPLDDALLSRVRYLVLNRGEAALLADRQVEDAEGAMAAAWALRARGATSVVVTLGAEGVCWAGPDGEGRRTAFAVDAADTTGAGDAFCGALAVRLVEGADLAEAVGFATAAAALATRRPGAQSSLPERRDVDAFLAEQA